MPKFTSFTWGKTNANFLCFTAPHQIQDARNHFQTFRANPHPICNPFLLISRLSLCVTFSESCLHSFSQVTHHFWEALRANICDATSLSSFRSRSAAVFMKGILSREVLSLLSVMLTNMISLLLLLSDQTTST